MQPSNQSALPIYSHSSLLALDTNVASAAEAFTQFAPYAAAWRLVGDYELRFALAAEAFLPGFHGTVTGSNGHGAKLDAAAA